MEELILNNDRYYGIKSVVPIFGELEKKGIAKIQRIEIKDSRVSLQNLRAIMDGGRIFRVIDGHYIRLIVNKELVMSDTGMERLSNEKFIHSANGHVLIAGLGIGLIVYTIMHKECVKSITVIEKYQDVIDLVAPKFPTVKIICADIFDWKPAKGEKFDTIYFDIWPHICTDSLADIKILHNKFKNSLNRANTDHYMNSWMKEYLILQRRRDNWDERQRSSYFNHRDNVDKLMKELDKIRND